MDASSSISLSGPPAAAATAPRVVFSRIFPYHWFIDETETDATCIRLYGLNEMNKSVCLRIDDFSPYVYVELGPSAVWSTDKARRVSETIIHLMGAIRPLNHKLVHMKRLYGAHLDKNGKRETCAYLKCEFGTKNHGRILTYKLFKPITIFGLGKDLQFKVHENDASPILQLTCNRDISTAGWINFRGRTVEGDDIDTLCDREYTVSWKKLTPHVSNVLPSPLIMGFDIEVNSHDQLKFPNAEIPEDKAFQISCVFSRCGGDGTSEAHLLSLGNPDQSITGENVIIHSYSTETKLLEGYVKLIRDKNPNIIMGYNIFGFDIPYLINRAKYCRVELNRLGCHKHKRAQEKMIKWSSAAFKNQEFQYLDGEGRLFVDLLPLIKNNYKLNNYKLKTVAEYFIGETKDPLSVQGIFKCYRLGTTVDKVTGLHSENARKAMAICGKYCVQDSALTILLMEKLKIWPSLVEMAKTCRVPIFSLYTQGQQIRVYSQVYKYCFDNKIVVEKDGYKVAEGERYVGAHVFPPVPGRYENVVPFDFASLYPTTIIAYNIDYHTHVPESSSIPDSLCNVMEWEDHVGCIHDPNVIRKTILTTYINTNLKELDGLRKQRDKAKGVAAKERFKAEIERVSAISKPYISERSDLNKSKPKVILCACRKYRFLKEPKGVIPTVLQNLLDARRHTRKVDMKVCYTELSTLDHDPTGNAVRIKEIKSLLDVLDKRQLAYKVSCNSMYGAMGVSKGYLPFMPGAMCTTYMGRVNIEKVAATIPAKFGGELIYGDTDCVVAGTPVLIRDPSTATYFYRTVEQISDGVWTGINENKDISSCVSGWQIWSDGGWTPIVNVVRCRIQKPLSRVITRLGVVDCSNEHSLLRPDLTPCTPIACKNGELLCSSELPLPHDTPNEPREFNFDIREIEGQPVSVAFVWGLFMGCGTCSSGSFSSTDNNKSKWKLNLKLWKHTRIHIMQQIREIIIKDESLTSNNTMNHNTVEAVDVLDAGESEHHFDVDDDTWWKRFYVLSGNPTSTNINPDHKKVPDEILMADLSVRCEFFSGFMKARRTRRQPDELRLVGPMAAAGLFFLAKSVGYEVSVNTHDSNPDLYHLFIEKTDKKKNVIRRIAPIKLASSPLHAGPQYIYDLQTVNHHFAAGVGETVIHNSNYIHFPRLKTAAETWDHALYVASELTKLFPPPIELEFEQEIYAFFFILTKKRYMYRKCLRDGLVDKKIGKKGVLLARRDNAKVVRDLYETVITMIADNRCMADVFDHVITDLNLMCSGTKPISDFIITKAVGDCGELVPIDFLNDKNVMKVKLGDYTVPKLPPVDSPEYQVELEKKDVNNATDYYLSCLPAHIQLTEKMRRRGNPVDSGTRVEYVISDPYHHTAKQYQKIESVDYMLKHMDVLKLDFLYYIKALSNPLDQVLNVAFGTTDKFIKDFVLKQYNFRHKTRKAVLEQIKNIFYPKVVFVK